jgi:hypothetical protein
MAKKEYSIEKVVAEVSRRTKMAGKVIDVKRGSVGIAFLGKLDFLGKMGYIVRFVG